MCVCVWILRETTAVRKVVVDTDIHIAITDPFICSKMSLFFININYEFLRNYISLPIEPSEVSNKLTKGYSYLQKYMIYIQKYYIYKICFSYINEHINIIIRYVFVSIILKILCLLILSFKIAVISLYNNLYKQFIKATYRWFSSHLQRIVANILKTQRDWT